MNKRQAKKKIPKDTPYCYTLEGITCPHRKEITNPIQISHLCQQCEVKSEENCSDCPEKDKVSVCSYCHANTVSDIVFWDYCKSCGENY